MRSLLTLVGAAVVTFAVAGWFLGWYKVRTTPGADGHREVNIDFNGPKIQQDLKTGEQRILNATHRAADVTGVPANGPLPLPTPGTSAVRAVPQAPPGPLVMPMPSPGTPSAGTTVIVRPEPVSTLAPNSVGVPLPLPPQ